MQAIISTVGTSLLTNKAPEETRMLLVRTANLREGEYAPQDLQAVRARCAEVEERLRQARPEEVRRLSAELNGILSLGADTAGTLHYLLATDTFQGREAARIAAEWLRSRGASAVVQPLEGLSTANREAFARGIDRLLQWCEETLPELRRQQHRIVFNLAGSFKSLQAYAQTLGMFYADEIVYIFEGSGSELIRIPRLPIALEHEPLKRHAAAVARLCAGEILSAAELEGLPEAYLDLDDQGYATLSEWGRLAWNRSRQEILGERLLSFPGLEYEDSFRRDFERRQDPRERVALQETLAKVSTRWRERGLAGLREDGGLRYEDYKNREGIGHFRVNDNLRVSCVPEGGILRLRRFGPHSINEDP